MQERVRAVVIGGGVVGCSILFHLAKLGWKEVLLLERDQLTCGSSWHAAGQIHTISSDPNISRLQGYTIRLYDELEQLSGLSVGLHATGGFYLASNRDWHDYLKRERSKARSMGLDQEFIAVEEAARRHPLIDPARYIAALWDPLDGDIDPSGVTHAYAGAARALGAAVETETPVTATRQRRDGSWEVETPKGVVVAEHVVNAGGLWAREVGAMAGLHLPLQPMEHHYLVTEDIPAIVEREARLPAGIDYEGNLYFRQEGGGLLLGTYEPQATPWALAGTPPDFGRELLEPKLDRIAERLELAFERIPALRQAGIKSIVNGPFVFGPDGNPLIGPLPGLRNYWLAVGVMAGFCQAGGVGLTLAQWMIEGEAEIDVWAMDAARFGDFASPAWGTVKSRENYQRRFVMTFPNETLPAGRRQMTTALYDRLSARGAVWDQTFGLEHALWFADGPDDAHEEPTFRRSRAHGYVAREVAAVRTAVGASEIANFAKHELAGPGAGAFLDRLLAGRLPGVGRLALAPMLTPRGRLAGDFTVACLAPDRYWLIGSGAMQQAHRRRFEAELPASGVAYRNLSGLLHGIALSGPRSRELLAGLVREDVSALAFRDVRASFAGGVPVHLARLSFSGELGFELYTEPGYLLRLYEAVEEAGRGLGLAWYGARALMSLRLEKGWGVWGLDLRPDFTAGESGLDAFIDWSKEFVGKDAALAERQRGPKRRLVTMTVASDDIDAVGDEAIVKDGEAVGYVTSGGFAHHVGQSVAMGYLPTALASPGTAVEIELDGSFHAAEVQGQPLYDPKGLRMRA